MSIVTRGLVDGKLMPSRGYGSVIKKIQEIIYYTGQAIKSLDFRGAHK
jgi:hypothetical protein